VASLVSGATSGVYRVAGHAQLAAIAIVRWSGILANCDRRWILPLGYLLRLLAPFARTFPRSCETVGDLAKLTLARNYSKIATEHGISSELEVLAALRQLIAAEESIDVQTILPDTLFPEGLNIY
jgi:hypothetical protein